MKDFPEDGGNVKASTARKQNKTKKNPETWIYTTLYNKSTFSTFRMLHISQVAEGKKIHRDAQKNSYSKDNHCTYQQTAPCEHTYT